MKLKTALSLLLSALVATTAVPASAASEPLDLRQSYSGFSAVDVAHILTYNTYANGTGATNSFAFGPGVFSFEDPFLKSSANPSLYTYFLGVSDDDPTGAGAAGQHLVLALTSAYAAGLVSGGQDFSTIFPTFDENSLINDLILIDTEIDQNDPAFALQQAARNDVGSFSDTIRSRGGLTPAFGGPLSLLSFSSATLVGNGNAAITAMPGAGAVPEPATWAMMIIGLALVGAALRRRNVALAAT